MMMMAMTQAKTGRSRKNLDSITRLRQFDFVDFAVGWVFSPGAAPSLPRASKGTSFTEAPGRTFCIPSTITRSPWCKTRCHKPLVADGPIEGEHPLLNLAFGVHDQGQRIPLWIA